MARTSFIAALVLLALVSACSKKDRDAVQPGTAIDDFKFKPKTAEEMAKPASAPRTAIDDFKFTPKTAAEMSASTAKK